MDARVRKQLEAVASEARVCLLVREPEPGGAAGTPAVYGEPDTPAGQGDPAVAGVIIAPMIRPASFPQRSRQHASESWRRYLNSRGVQGVEELNRLASDGSSRERVETDPDSPYFGALMRGPRPVVDGVRLAGLRPAGATAVTTDLESLAERLNLPLIDEGRAGVLRAIVPLASATVKSVVVLLNGGVDLHRLGEALKKAGGELKPAETTLASAYDTELGLDELVKLAERSGG